MENSSEDDYEPESHRTSSKREEEEEGLIEKTGSWQLNWSSEEEIKTQQKDIRKKTN